MGPGEVTREAGEARRLFHEARRHWGDLGVSLDEFLKHIEERIPSQDREKALKSLHYQDVYLALAALKGHSSAWTLLRKRHDALLFAVVQRRNIPLQEGEDLVQAFWSELLLPPKSGTVSRLATFSGRSALSTWLAVTFSHHLVDGQRRKARHGGAMRALEEVHQAGEAAVDGPDEALLRGEARLLVHQAFQQAMESLPPREGATLSLYYIEGARLREIGQILGIHEANVSRRLKKIRKTLEKRILRALQEKGLSRREALSMIQEGLGSPDGAG